MTFNRFAQSLELGWQWWTGQLADLVPEKFRELFTSQAPTLSLILDEQHCTLRLDGTDAPQQLGEYALGGIGTADGPGLPPALLAELPAGTLLNIHLPAQRMLVHEVLLPLAVEERLASVLQFEIDRLTPFALPQVALGYQVVGKYPDKDKIMVRLHVAKRDYLDRLVRQCALPGLTLAGIYPPLPDRAARPPYKRMADSLNLLSGDSRIARPKGPAIPLSKLNLGVLLTLGLVLLYPWWRLNNEIARLNDEVSVIRVEAGAVATLRASLLDRIEAQSSLVKRKRASPSRLTILNELTTRLPDDSWVSRLQLENDRLVIQGESRNTSTLIELLETSPLFNNVRFGSSVTRNPSTGMERFEIGMNLERAAYE